MHLTEPSRPPKCRRKIAAWFGIWALSLPMLASIAQGVALANPANDHETPFYMVLCKAMQGDPAQPPEQNPDIWECPVCFSLSFGKSLLAPALTEIPVAQVQSRILTFSNCRETIGSLSTSSIHARAPPASV